MKLLGAVIAGGRSTRMGTDKAALPVGDKPLIEQVATGLMLHVDEIVVAGRSWADFKVVDDGDYAGEGPLAGLLAALLFARANGFDAVISAPCDALPIPDLHVLIGDQPAVIDGLWLFGFWPVATVSALETHLSGQTDRSVRRWIERSGAQRIASTRIIHNLNTPADIMLYEAALEQAA